MIPDTRERVLSNIREAVRLIEACTTFHMILPEVGTNVAMATEAAESLSDVAGLTGRIIKVESRAVAVGEPKFHATGYMGAVLLRARKYDGSVRAVINIRNSSPVLTACQALSIQAVTHVWAVKPQDAVESKCSIPFILDALQDVPEVVYDFGDVGIEAVLAIFGRSAVDVAGRAVRIAEKVAELTGGAPAASRDCSPAPR
jgi:hydroxymethylpyrimidine/phosphomethylpyrimidine kinase